MAVLQSAPKSVHNRIYGVSLASIFESFVFITLYGWLVREFTAELGWLDQSNWSRIHMVYSSRNLAITMLISYCVRIVLALIILKKTYNTCITFYIVTQIGIAFNLLTGFLGTYALLTYGIGILTLCVIGLHVLYLVLMHKVIQTMRNDNNNSLELAYGRSAVQPGSNAPHGINYNAQVPCPPYKTDINSAAHPCYAQAPPSYEAEFEKGQQIQSEATSKKF